MALVETPSYSLSRRKRFDILRSQLDNERQGHVPQWKDCAQHVLPYRVRLSTSEANRGDRKNQKIIDSTATLAARTARAGMFSGITSPARPWFKLTTPDPQLAEIDQVKHWLHIVAERMTTIFLRSNLYTTLPTIYSDLLVFGTGAVLVEEDLQDGRVGVKFTALPVGSYWIAVDSKGRVNTFMREFSQTVRQVVEKFGQKNERTGKIDWSNISTHVRALWETGAHDSRIDVTQVILPNPDHDPRRLGSKYKKFLSCYYESGGGSGGLLGAGGYLSGDLDQERFLRESGYDYFPVLSPRWEVTGDDPYASTWPALEALGDIRQLQQGEKRIAEAIEKMMRPPMKGPTSLLNRDKSILPGSFTAVDDRDGKGFSAVFELDPRIQEMEMKQEQIRERIKRAFFEDLFLMMAYTDRKQITAREIDERREEKLLALGPVLEQLNQDFLDPLIDITFAIMADNGLLPEAPEEIQGLQLKVEYVSIMAQAQKLVAIGGLERYTGFIAGVQPIFPSIVHKVNFDQLADEYAEASGISPRVNRTEEEVTAIREAEAEAAQAQAQMEQLQAGARTAKDMSQTSLEGENMLSSLLERASQSGIGERLAL